MGTLEFAKKYIARLGYPVLTELLLRGSSGEPEWVEPEYQQTDGPGHEDYPPHQQGGDGKSC